MKIALAIIALFAVIPLTLLADKDKDKNKDLKVTVHVPDKSGVSVENIATPPGMFSFTLKNHNSYAVRISGNYFQAWGFHSFETDIKANGSEIITGGTSKGTELSKIVVDKVEKKN